jgi:hypothetical protein
LLNHIPVLSWLIFLVGTPRLVRRSSSSEAGCAVRTSHFGENEAKAGLSHERAVG